MTAVSADDLRAWLAGETGGEVCGWQRLVSGNSRATFAADVRVGEAELNLVVRHDAGAGPVAGTELSLEREATVYRALAGRGLPVPRLHGSSVALRAIATSRMPGATADAAAALPGLLACLARLHRLPVGQLELPGFARSARAELELWGSIAAEKLSGADEVVAFALEVLREHFPGEPARLVLCHGDAGEGNFLAQDGRLTALLDWEFSHLGDPHDDLAWISVRALMYGHEIPGFGALVREHYARAAGVSLDPGRFRYWQAVVLLRNLICVLSAAGQPEPASDRTIHLMLLPGLRARLMRLLAELLDVTVDPPEPFPPPVELPGALLLREVIDGLGEMSRVIEDPGLRVRAKRARRLLAAFAETWPVAAEAARASAAERVTAGGDVTERLRYLSRAAERELSLLPRLSPVGNVALAGLDDHQCSSASARSACSRP